MRTERLSIRKGTTRCSIYCTTAVVLLLTAAYITAYQAHLKLGSGAEAPYHYGCRYPITNLTLYKLLLFHYVQKTKFPPL